MTVYLGDKAVGANTIVEKEVGKTKFGVSIDNLIGDVDENGIYQEPTETFELDLTGLIAQNANNKLTTVVCPYLCAGNKNLVGTIDLSNFEGEVGWGNGHVVAFTSAFMDTSITDVILPRKKNDDSATVEFNNTFAGCMLNSVEFLCDKYGSSDGFLLRNSFDGCTIENVKGIENIKEIEKSGLFNTFANATLPEEWYFNSLTTINGEGFYATFKLAKGIKKLYFPALVNATADAFGSLSSTAAFYTCTSITEIHFRADMQATVEAMKRYSSKFGASNATIYFDL